MTGAKENGVEYATYRPKVHSENRMTWDILSENHFDTGLKKGEIKWINPIQACRCNPESSALYSSHTMRSEGEPGRIDNLNDQSVPGTLWCDRGNYYLINKRGCCVEGWGLWVGVIGFSWCGGFMYKFSLYQKWSLWEDEEKGLPALQDISLISRCMSVLY